MARYRGPSLRLSRREGTDLMLKSGVRAIESKCNMETAPGVHGLRRGRLSDYGLQLREKQKVRRMYGVLEKQFRNYYKKAAKAKGNTGENLLSYLEQRLDNVVYRMGFASTRAEARQLVSHGHVMVNGKVVDRKSYQIKDGDEISLQQNSQNIPMIIQTLSSNERDVPEYLQLEISKCIGKFIRGPQLTDVPYPVQMEPNLVVEYYAKN